MLSPVSSISKCGVAVVSDPLHPVVRTMQAAISTWLVPAAYRPWSRTGSRPSTLPDPRACHLPDAPNTKQAGQPQDIHLPLLAGCCSLQEGGTVYLTRGPGPSRL